jgi:hypothetical protein
MPHYKSFGIINSLEANQVVSLAKSFHLPSDAHHFTATCGSAYNIEGHHTLGFRPRCLVVEGSEGECVDLSSSKFAGGLELSFC